MKKYLIVTLVFASSLIAATNEEIISYFKVQIPIPSVKIDVTSRISVDTNTGLDYVSLIIRDGARLQKISVFTKGEFIFTDIISVKEGSMKNKLDKAKLISSISKVYKSENKKNIIEIGHDKNKQTIVTFFDPECPFCRKELEQIEKSLKTHNYKFIFTPVHDRSSLEKTFLIYKQTANLTNDVEKIKIFRKYFNGDVDAKVSDEQVNQMEQLRRKYFNAGLNGVPFSLAEKDLLR